jgi:hypothetical protein
VAPPSQPSQEPAKQTPAQKRAATLAAKKAAAERRAAAREARRAERPVAEPAAEQEEAAPIASELDDRTLRENIAAGLEVVWLVVSLVAGLFGRRLKPYSDAEREADAKAWLPLAKRWTWVGSTAGWVGAPVRLVQRVREKLEPKPPKVNG